MVTRRSSACMACRKSARNGSAAVSYQLTLEALRSQVGDYTPTRAVCPMIGTGKKYDYDRCTFCTVCPDAHLIPSGCDLSCGWPDHIATSAGRACVYIDQCPCARPASGERAEAMLRWNEGRAERRQVIKEALNGKKQEVNRG